MAYGELGRIEVYTGCMCAGKTLSLILQLRDKQREALRRSAAVAYKWSKDTKNPTCEISSRLGASFPATEVESIKELNSSGLVAIGDDAHVIGIDEGHFFGERLYEVALNFAHNGALVVVALLDVDLWGRPIPAAANLLAVANKVTKMDARCVRCGRVATRSQALGKPPSPDDLSNPELVGGDEKYEPRCLICFDPPELK